jgi:PTS system galactitol-specific IIA component
VTDIIEEVIRIETSEKLTLVGTPFTTKEEVINDLAERMSQGGYIKDSYLEAVLERETKMPTGLITQAYGIAIPHSDPEHVNRSAIAVALLNEPVIFKNMAAPEEDVPVRLVLLLAIAEKGSVTKVLARLAEMFLSPDLLNQFLTMKTAAQLSTHLSCLIQGKQQLS